MTREYSTEYSQKFSKYRFKVVMEFDRDAPSDKIAFEAMRRDLLNGIGGAVGEHLSLFRVLSIIKDGKEDILVPETADVVNKEPPIQTMKSEGDIEDAVKRIGWTSGMDPTDRKRRGGTNRGG